MIPLLSPKPLSEYSPEDFKAYIESLYVAPPEKKPPAEFSVRPGKKGPVITVRRKPKFLTYDEAAGLALEVEMSLQGFLTEVRKRKIELRPVLKQQKA